MKKTALTTSMLCLITMPLLAQQQNTFPNNGNVGIGTTSPSVKLEVNGQLKVEQQAWLNGNLKMNNLQEVESLPGNSGANGNGNAGSGNNGNQIEYSRLYIDENGIVRKGTEKLVPVNTNVNHCDTDPVGGGGDGGPKVLFREDGLMERSMLNDPKAMWNFKTNVICSCPEDNVGIGTCIPRVKLDVAGTAYMEKAVIGDLNPAVVGNKLLSIKAPGTYSPADRLVSIINANNSEILSLRSNGLFSTVGRIVHSSGLSPNDNSVIFNVENSSGSVFSMTNSGALNTYQINATHKFFLNTQRNFSDQSIEIYNVYNGNNGSLLNIKSGGSFGFNTNALDYIQYRFHSNKDLAFELEHNADTDYEQALNVKVNRDLTRAISVNSSLSGSDVQVFGVLGDGKTTIGSGLLNVNHQGAMLTVKGKIVSKSMLCTVNGWADYVFDKDYKAMSLEETEKYYNEHKHLPEIPSEKEVLENGLDLAEMNKLLLKKIEEMTLILVEQEKRLKALENQK